MPRKGDVVLVKREVNPRGEALEDPLPDSRRIHAMLVLTVCACFRGRIDRCIRKLPMNSSDRSREKFGVSRIMS